MKLIKTEEDLSVSDFPAEKFGEPVTVQGGTKRSAGNAILVQSGGRYKLFTEGRDLIKFLEGEGHFKWARGELSFRAGETFLAEKTGEYEINGKCAFIAVRN
ncbi:MAG: hypothetical protein ACI4ST_03755 [Candidatus Gallimonas sp.]